MMNKTEYIVGEIFNPAGMSLIAVFGTQEPQQVVLNDITWSPYQMGADTT